MLILKVKTNNKIIPIKIRNKIANTVIIFSTKLPPYKYIFLNKTIRNRAANKAAPNEPAIINSSSLRIRKESISTTNNAIIDNNPKMPNVVYSFINFVLLINVRGSEDSLCYF